MKKFFIGFGMALLVLPLPSFAQDRDYMVNDHSDEANNNTNSLVPEGTQVIKVGDLNLVVPKGARITHRGSQLIVEDPGQYMGRKFEEIDRRLNKIEQKLQELEKKK